ncbi:hypothetical protein Gorai_007251, partial [Gossypium raimondii]|nr:hypothetical protein [Gossypium raimondii]
ALNLGCYPVRASRSQRHSNPRTYLTPRAPETVPATPRILDNGSEDRCPQLSPVQSGSQLARIATNVNSNTSVSQANRHNYPFLPQNCPSGHDQLMRMETNSPSNSGQVYPLYYGIHYQNAESQTGSPVQENLVSDTIIVGRPIGSSVLEPAEMGSLQNFFSSSNVDIGGKRIGLQDIRHTDEKLLGKECDLSLRLGLFSDPCMQVEKKSLCETTDVGPSNTQDGGKLSDVFQQKSKEIPFFPERTVNDHFESFSRKCFMENEGHNVGAATRKRKATFGGNSEDEQFCKQPGSSSNNRRHGPELMFLFAFGEWSRVDFSLFVALEFLVDMNASRVIHRRDGKRNLSVVRNRGSLKDWKWITADAGDMALGWEQGSHACLCGVIHLSSQMLILGNIQLIRTRQMLVSTLDPCLKTLGIGGSLFKFLRE